LITSIRFDRISKRFGNTLALRGISGTFERGLTILEGPNGSGKSTLLGILGGVVRPTAGKVTFDSDDGSSDARSEVGWLSHDTLGYADLTGRENIELAARLHGMEARAAWVSVVDRFDLGSFSERRLRTNSRGQKQRISLARAMVHGPSVLLLDEPTTGLDTVGVERLLRVLAEELEKLRLIVVVTHEPEPFISMSTARFRLDRGRVAEDVSRETSAQE
jgi:ABC-type multidrug transport system ATPase subunit